MAEMGNPLRVVVFGGIGSGKSTVANLLAERGAKIIEADKLGHLVLASAGEAFAAVAERWPQVIDSGEVSRTRLAAIVFADPAALAELEAMTHPHIRSRIRSIVAESTEEPIALEMPIPRDFVGEGWVRVLVDAPAAMRVDRAVLRGVDRADAEVRAAAQPDEHAYHEAADWVIANTGTLEDLAAAVGELWEQLAA